METLLTISFALSPGRPAKALNGPVKVSDYPLPYATRSLLEHAEANLYTQLVAGWQFSMYLFTADLARGQAIRLHLRSRQASFVYHLKRRTPRILFRGPPSPLETPQKCA